MSYMRGEFYIWSDGDNLHINGLTIPESVIDEFVAMRWAQLTPEERDAARTRAATNHAGNFGCDPLREELGLPTGLDMLKQAVEDSQP